MSEDKIVDTREDKTDEDEFLQEIRENYDWAWRYEQVNTIPAMDDLAKLNGDHWDPDTVTKRREDGRPTLTINKLPGFVDQVKGDARLNQMQIKVRANHPGSEDQRNNKPQELARIYNGLIRQIEQVSRARLARQGASDSALQNGFGFYEIDADFVDDDTFVQEIRTRRIRNQFSVLFDPMHVESDGRDAKWVIKSDEIRKKEFKTLYPDVEPSQWRGGIEGSYYEHWFMEDTVRVAVYWVKRPFKKTLVSVNTGETYDEVKWLKVENELKEREQVVHLNEQGIPTPGPAPEGSGLPEEIINPAPVVVRRREIDSHVVVKYIVDGAQIIDGPRNDKGKIILDFKSQNDIKQEVTDPVTGETQMKFRKFVWPSRYIPIIPVWGKELQIGNQVHRRSLIRNSKDAALMYNYERTAETERVALAKIPPALITPEQVKGYDAMWKSPANLKYLLYNHITGQSLPFFPPAPQASSGHNLLSQTATQDMKDTMSIQNPSLGIQGNEQSGKAILARQRENDVANFEFSDNSSNAMQLEGDIYVDLIPHYYDTERQILIMNEDGTDEFVTINETVKDNETGQEVVLNDLTIGKYLVTVTTGPNFSTQRIETAEALTALAGGVKDPLVNAILTTQVVRNLDFPLADETAEKMEKASLPPELRNLSEEEEAALAQQQGQEQQPTGEQIMEAAKLQGQLLKNQETQLDIDKKEKEQRRGDTDLAKTVRDAQNLIAQIQGGQ